MLPDAVTELGLFAPLPDPEDLLRDDFDRRGPGKDPTLLDFGTSQLLPDDEATPRRKKRTMELDDMDLELDFGLGPGEQAIRSTPLSAERSIEMGRREPTPRRDEPTLLDNDDLGIDFNFDPDTTLGGGSALPNINNDDQQMLDIDDGLAAQNEAAFARADEAARRQRNTDSPLSDIRASQERTFQLDADQMEEDESTMVQAQQRIKRRKVMQEDSETQLHNSQIKKQQQDRSAITKAPSFLPRDPLLLSLMEMQRNGSFVSTLMGNGRMEGWAPELRGILSLEVVRKAGEKKRKRDSGVADMGETSEDDMARQQTPELEIPDIDATVGDFNDFAPLHSDGPLLHEEDLPEGEDYTVAGPAFDTTEAPLLHPAESGAISLGTKRAVHLLREHFAPAHTSTEPPTPSKRVKQEALFTDLCPEADPKTGKGGVARVDATKMFFELLVLGTKDAVRVEQDDAKEGLVGGRMRIRGKRGLWGDWAEMSTGTQQLQQVGGEEVAA